MTSSSRDSRSRSHGRYRSTSSSTPRDPYNPLKLAHRVNKRRSRDGYDDGPPKDDERWKHDLYESDGERAAHEAKFRAQKQNVGYVVDTRRGSWRSRAGGVYLSPKEQVEDDLYEDYRRKSYRSSPSYSRD